MIFRVFFNKHIYYFIKQTNLKYRQLRQELIYISQTKCSSYKDRDFGSTNVISWAVRVDFTFNINLYPLNYQSCFILFFKAIAKIKRCKSFTCKVLFFQAFNSIKYIGVAINFNFKITSLTAKLKKSYGLNSTVKVLPTNHPVITHKSIVFIGALIICQKPVYFLDHLF